jgi:xanthine dehydrogenase accessory factor
LPMPLLYIFGGGHVALALFKAARNAGFDCIVADDREAYANAGRFPDAREVVAKDFDEIFAALAPTESSYMVICTRGHRDDMRVLRWAVQTPARYIGMVGSKRKAITVFRELTREGLDPALFDRVHSPVGLDIGAVTPEEIGVSIVAELIAMRRHAERGVPHMSWFHSGRRAASVEAETTSPAESLPHEKTTS